MSEIQLTPISIKAANKMVAAWHRHNKPVHGALFAVGVSEGDRLCGVAIVGRPLSRMLQDGRTCEVVRVATDGTYNACSKLYGACCRAAKALGYARVLTKTLVDEPGASLKASGFIEIGLTKDEAWGRPSRQRDQVVTLGIKRRWERSLGPQEPSS